MTAHQAPWVLVVGISVEFNRTGKYGEVHAKFTPDAIIENVPKIKAVENNKKLMVLFFRQGL